VNNKLRLFAGLSLVFVFGCPADPEPENPTTGGSSDSSTTDPGMTSQAMTTTAETGEATDSATTTATTTSATTIQEETGEVCPAPDAAELGGACADGCDCVTEECFVVGPLGGVCSECDSDEDCPDAESGCNFGNPLNGTAATCSDGSVGSGCQSADACQAGLFCPTLIEVPGIISVATCSECEADGDCMGGQLCVPTYDIENIAGNYLCVDAGTIADDEGCNLMGDGSECISTNCAPASLMGIPVVGVCSPCNEDMDCAMGETCQFPEVAVNGTALELVPGACI